MTNADLDKLHECGYPAAVTVAGGDVRALLCLTHDILGNDEVPFWINVG